MAEEQQSTRDTGRTSSTRSTSPLMAQFIGDEPVSFYLRLFVWGIAILLLVLVTSVGRALAPVLKPVILSIFLCYLIFPLIRWQQEKRVAAPVAYLNAFLLIGGGFYVVGRVVASNWRSFKDRFPTYQANLEAMDERLTRFVFDLGLLTDDAQLLYSDSIFEMIPADTYGRVLSNSTGFFLDFVAALFVVAFFMVFLFWEAHRFDSRMEWAFGPENGAEISRIIDEINDDVQRYLRLKFIVSVTTGLISGGIMYAFGLDFYAALALVIMAFNFIPYVGSIAATFLPFLVGLAQFDAFWTAFWMGFALSLVQQLMGNIIEPRLQGRGLNLSPFIILATLAFFGWMWGIVGMLVSVPLTSAIRLILAEFEHTRPLAVLMSDLELDDHAVHPEADTGVHEAVISRR